MSIQFPAARQPVVTQDVQTGVTTFTRPWFLFFQGLFERTGGAIAADVDIDRGVGLGVEELQASTDRSLADLALNNQPMPLDSLQIALDAIQSADALRAEIGDLREQFAELQKTINGLSQCTSL